MCKINYTTKAKRLTNVERSKYTFLNNPLNDIIIGLLLGDGLIQNRNLSKNSRFIYAQSSLRENHLNYFYHININYLNLLFQQILKLNLNLF